MLHQIFILLAQSLKKNTFMHIFQESYVDVVILE